MRASGGYQKPGKKRPVGIGSWNDGRDEARRIEFKIRGDGAQEEKRIRGGDQGNKTGSVEMGRRNKRNRKRCKRGRSIANDRLGALVWIFYISE